MITVKYLRDLVAKYAESDEGKKKIKETYGVEYDPKFTARSAKKAGEAMKALLFNEIHDVIESITMDDIMVSEPYIGEDGLTKISLSFRDGSLHRESLRPDLYPEGLGNIVLLFTKGYHASHSIYGTWAGHGVETYSCTNRAPNDFLQRAVDSFNTSKYGQIATAELQGEYRGESESNG